MAAFSFERYPSSLHDSVLLPPTPAIKMSGLIEYGEMINASFFSFQDISFSPTPKSSSSFGNGSASPLDQLTADDSSSFAAEVANQLVNAERKRKNIDGSSLTSPHSKLKGDEGGKQKNSKKVTEEKRKPKAAKRSQKEANEVPPTGYIHVRARRGQATDSHSLAERVRREKISERMKLLQGLVPGCDKVVGKALVLDEIINYVQSLQNQVEFLSMKLAFHDFRVDVNEDSMAASQNPNSRLSQFQGIQQPEPSQANALRDPSHTSFPAINNYPLMISPDPHLLHEQSPESFPEENINLVWQMDKQREKLVGQAVYRNFCPFP